MEEWWERGTCDTNKIHAESTPFGDIGTGTITAVYGRDGTIDAASDTATIFMDYTYGSSITFIDITTINGNNFVTAKCDIGRIQS